MCAVHVLWAICERVINRLATLCVYVLNDEEMFEWNCGEVDSVKGRNFSLIMLGYVNCQLCEISYANFILN